MWRFPPSQFSRESAENAKQAQDFDANRFRHRAIYNERRERVEMHLVNLSDQQVRVAGSRIHFDRDECIVTEHSYKYTIRSFHRLAHRAGLRVRRVWSDPGRWFGLFLLE